MTENNMNNLIEIKEITKSIKNNLINLVQGMNI